MKLFQRQKTNASELQPLQQYLPEEQTVLPESKRRTILKRVAFIIVAIVIILLGVAGVHSLLTHNDHPVRSKTPVATSHTRKVTKKPPATSPSSPTAPSRSSGGQAVPSSPQPGASGAGSSKSNPGTTSQLSNTGPGDVLGWFAATSLLSTGLYYTVLLRRLKAGR